MQQIGTLRSFVDGLISDASVAHLSQEFAAMSQWLRIVQAAEPTATEDESELCSIGLNLLEKFIIHANKQKKLSFEIAIMPYFIGLWFASRGAKITEPETVIDALSLLANGSRDPKTLANICRDALTIAEAIPAVLLSETDAISLSAQPSGRTLLFNIGIMATRSHDVSLMDEAFNLLISHMPRSAVDFFKEGKNQVERTELNYPPEVVQNMLGFYQSYVEHTRH